MDDEDFKPSLMAPSQWVKVQRLQERVARLEEALREIEDEPCVQRSQMIARAALAATRRDGGEGA